MNAAAHSLVYNARCSLTPAPESARRQGKQGSQVESTAAVQLEQLHEVKKKNNKIILDVGSAAFLGIKESSSYAKHESDKGFAWQSLKGEGQTIETLKLPDIRGLTGERAQIELSAPGGVTVGALDLGLTQYEAQKEIARLTQQVLAGLNTQAAQQTASNATQTGQTQVIDLRTQAERLSQQPGLAWLGELSKRNDVDWQQIELLHDTWKYKHEGLTELGSAAVAIVVVYFTAGAASSAIGTAASATAGSGTAMAAGGISAGAGWANVALTAGATAATSNLAVSTINNKGDIGQALKETFNDEALKSYAVAALTAGVTTSAMKHLQNEGLLNGNLQNASALDRFKSYATKATISAGAKSVVQGTPLKDTLETALIDSLAQTLTSEIGDWGRGNEAQIGKILAHAAVQCSAAQLHGGDCGSAAVGAATAELLSPWLEGLEERRKETAFDQTLGTTITGLAAVLTAGLTGQNVNSALTAAQMVELYNRQLHPEEKLRIKELAKGDPEKEARLTAAACAMVRCADGVPITDPAYSYLRSLQDSGTSMTAEQAMLGIQRDASGESLFRYGMFDQAGDVWSQNKLGPRFAGAAQGTLGSLGVAGSAALCTSGIGCAAGAVTGTISADYAQAGMKQAWTGDVATTYGEQVLQSLGMSPEAAAYTYAALGMAPVTLEAVLAARAVNNVAQYNTLARASYADFTPQGIKATNEVMATPQAQAMMAELKAGSPGLSDDLANRFVIEWLESGNSLPTAAVVNSETTLLKVVPKGNGVSPTTAFWVSSEQAQALAKMSPQQVGQALGLPAAQAAKMLQNGVEYYAIMPKPGANPMVFVSEVAQTSQGSIRTTPNTTQIIVPNRALWSDPKPVNPTTLR